MKPSVVRKDMERAETKDDANLEQRKTKRYSNDIINTSLYNNEKIDAQFNQEETQEDIQQGFTKNPDGCVGQYGNQELFLF